MDCLHLEGLKEYLPTQYELINHAINDGFDVVFLL